MTNNCDLEEMKHIAQQKFIELVDSGVEWENTIPGFAMFGYDGWIMIECDERYYSVSLNNVDIWRKQHSDPSGDFSRRYKYGPDLTAFLNDPMVKACQKIIQRHRDCENRKTCLKLLAALKTLPEPLQEALKDTATTLDPEVQTGNTEPYTKPQGHSDTPSVGEWFVIRYGSSEMEVCILEVRDDAVKWGKPSWLVSDGIWAKTWEFKEKVRVSLGIGKPRRWGWWRMTSRDLFFPYSRPKP